MAGLHDIVLNLLFNAVDALPDGGDIWIETRPTEQGALVSVKDNGVGMTDEVRRRVFDPFFTTKAHVGTGLGLSTVYGQVTRWGGEIGVDSRPGEGATFTIVFRQWDGLPEQKNHVASKKTRKRGRILLVEDEETVRDVVSRILILHHEVKTASSGEDALSGFEPGMFDVALIDLGMPGLPGDKVAERLRDVDASISTVLMTGWSLAKDDARLAAFDDHVQKPFTEFDELLDVIGRAIATHETRIDQTVTPG
jgi:CheY-like chemotaxis protein